jgi:hypothetical protein
VIIQGDALDPRILEEANVKGQRDHHRRHQRRRGEPAGLAAGKRAAANAASTLVTRTISAPDGLARHRRVVSSARHHRLQHTPSMCAAAGCARCISLGDDSAR